MTILVKASSKKKKLKTAPFDLICRKVSCFNLLLNDPQDEKQPMDRIFHIFFTST